MRPVVALPVLLLAGGCFLLSDVVAQKTTEPGHLEVDAGVLVAQGGALPIVSARFGVAPRFDIGTRYDTLGWAFDTRLQYLTQSEHRVDSSLEVGVGTALISFFWYAGTGVAHDFGKATPYFHFRYMRTLVDRGEMSGESNNVVQELYVTFSEEAMNITQIFAGVELEINEHWYFVPEVVWVPQLDNWVQFNGVMKFRF